MTWTDPRTWALADDVDAADLNEQIRDNLNALRSAYWCRVYLNTNTTLPQSTTTTISFAAESSDTQGWHSTTTNPSRVTPDMPGTYLIHGCLKLLNTSGNALYGGQELLLLRNGAAIASFGRYLVNDGGFFTASTVTPANGTTDYFGLAMWRNAGGGNNLSAVAGEFNTWLSVTFLGA